MAYINFSSLDVETPTASDAGRFSPLELRVIDLAERIDATREIAPQTRLGGFIERALGFRLAGPLADPRLESLRRFASLARHHTSELAEADIRTFLDAGYSGGQAYGLVTYLSGQRRRQVH